jgi:hypothetical protein
MKKGYVSLLPGLNLNWFGHLNRVSDAYQ